MEHKQAVTLLESKGIRPTVQRVETARILLGTNRHCTASELLHEVNDVYPRVSRASIFNILSLFEEKGLVRKLEYADSETIYDSNTGRHHHIVDTSDGRVVDIELPAELEEQLKELLNKQAAGLNGNHSEIELKITGYLK